MEDEKDLDPPTQVDLSDVLSAVRDKSITKEELVWILADNVDSDNLIEILVEEFGIVHARRLMMKSLRIAKQHARQRRINKITFN